MRAYTPSPDFADHSEEIPLVKITLADQVCAAEPYTLRFPSANNRYIPALTLYFTDDEMDFFTEAIAAARAERLAQQEKAYETLQAKFGGTWDNRPAAGFDGEPATDDTHLADGE
jgi:hypothetical protein